MPRMAVKLGDVIECVSSQRWDIAMDLIVGQFPTMVETLNRERPALIRHSVGDAN